MIESFHFIWVKKFFQRPMSQNILIFPKNDDHMMEYNKNLLDVLNKFLKSI